MMLSRTIFRVAALPALLLAGMGCALSVPAQAQTRGDQDQARKEMKAGNVRSLRDIERDVLPRMKGSQYLGPEYDAAAMAYRLKFIRDGRVMFVDVDARTGRIIRRSN